MATAVERWEESYRVLKEQHGMEELGEQYRMTALRCLLVGDIKRHIELKEGEIETYQQLRTCIMTYAVARKLEKERASGHSPMDIGQLSKWPYDQEPALAQSMTGYGKGPEDYSNEDWSTWQEEVELYEYRRDVDPGYLDYQRDVIGSVQYWGYSADINAVGKRKVWAKQQRQRERKGLPRKLLQLRRIRTLSEKLSKVAWQRRQTKWDTKQRKRKGSVPTQLQLVRAVRTHGQILPKR